MNQMFHELDTFRYFIDSLCDQTLIDCCYY